MNERDGKQIYIIIAGKVIHQESARVQEKITDILASLLLSYSEE